MVAQETVASATIDWRGNYMSKFMKMLNNISRSQAIYRHSRISAVDLQTDYDAFVLAICREFVCSQEVLVRELCNNKSTVQRNINYLEDKTCFIIAHRLSTLQNADTILVVKDGAIIEQGNHKERIKLGKFYTSLYHS